MAQRSKQVAVLLRPGRWPWSPQRKDLAWRRCHAADSTPLLNPERSGLSRLVTAGNHAAGLNGNNRLGLIKVLGLTTGVETTCQLVGNG